MQLFFYGTLMDPDVCKVVIGRDPEARLEGAFITGFRRVFVEGRNYPMLLAHAAGRVEGILAHGLDAMAIHRLMLFEGTEYHLVPLRVHAAEHDTRAGVFLCDYRMRPGSRQWTLAAWQRRHKRAFLRRAAYLMDHYGTQALLRRAATGMPALAATQQPKRLSGRPFGIARFIAG